MRKISFLPLAFLLTAIYTGVVAAPVKPVAKAAKPAVQKSPWTQAQILQYTKEIMPVVEQVTGRKFKKAPKIRVVTAKELATVLSLEMAQRMKNASPERPIGELKHVAEYSALLYSVHFWGMYSPHFKAVFLMPETIAASLADAKVDKKLYNPVMRVIIAHELSHALQDQETSLVGTMFYSRDPGKSCIGHMLVEGFAEFTSSKVADVIGAADGAAEIYRLSTKDWLAESKSKKDICIHSKLDYKAAREQYVEQFRFFSWQYEHGGYEKIWDVIAHPPASSKMFYDPSSYSATIPAGQDYGAALLGIEKRFGNRKWRIARYSCDMPNLIAGATEIVPKDAEKIRSSLMDSAAVNALYNLSSVDVRIYVANSSEGAMLMANYTREWFLKSCEPHAWDKSTKVIGRENTELKDDRFTFAAKQRIDTDYYIGNRSNHYEMVRGNAVVRVHTESWKLSDKQILDIGDEVLKKVEAMH